MYMHEPKTTDHPEPVPGGIQLTLWVSAAGILTLGVFPVSCSTTPTALRPS
jgi:hypothetical protein